MSASIKAGQPAQPETVAPSALAGGAEAPSGERVLAGEARALRTSGYVIYVELPDNRQEVLLVHGYTGAYDKVSRRVALYLRSLEPGTAPGPLYGTWAPELETDGREPIVRPSDDTIEVLKRRGYLTDKSVDEERAFFQKMASKLHTQVQRNMPGYILMPTYQCNLRCPYCFQDHMRTQPAFRHLLRTMQPEVVDRLFKALPIIEAGHGVEPGSTVPRPFTFFGGEPLLRQGRPIIEYILRKAQDLGKARFSAITNATELDAYADLLGPDNISSLQITLDGPPREHDQRRIYPDGSGSFEQIARNIDLALDRGVKISIRLNVDRNNVEELPELVEELHTRGWVTRKGFSVYAAPVHANNGKTAEESTFGSWELTHALLRMREQLPRARVIATPDDGLRDRVRRIFEEQASPMPFYKADFCGAHNRMYVFDAFGDIYACWERTGDPKIRIGHLSEAGEPVMNAAITAQWRSRNIVSNPVCRKCRYSFYCGGGCAILAERQNGSMHSNYCDSFGKRFRTMAAVAYQDHVSHAEAGPLDERVCDM